MIKFKGLILQIFIFTMPSLCLATVPNYNLKVEITPDTHAIRVQGTIENVPNELLGDLYLNQNFVMDSFAANETASILKAEIDTKSISPDYVGIAKKVVLPKGTSAHTLYFSYHGQVPEIINDVNLISPQLVELALYSGWYTYFKGLDNFTYEIKIQFPKEFVATSNGT